jgi:hypothetical protein
MSRALLCLAAFILLGFSLSCNHEPAVAPSPTPDPPAPPIGPATPTIAECDTGTVGYETAVLKGKTNPNGLSTKCYFQYGRTTSVVSWTESRPLGEGTAMIAVAETLKALQPTTQYYWRFVAFNDSGTCLGPLQSFWTCATPPPPPPPPPSQSFVLTSWALNDTRAQLSYTYTIQPGIIEMVTTVEYGTTLQYGQSLRLEGGSYPKRVIADLTPATTYHWRVTLQSRDGTMYYSPDATLQTSTSLTPCVFPLKVGATWRYENLWGGAMAPFPGQSVVTWRIVGTDGNGTWTCLNVQVDSLNHQLYGIDSVSFSIKEFSDYVEINFPERITWSPETNRALRRIDSGLQDTLKYDTTVIYGVGGYERAAYVSGVGMISYSARFPSMSGSIKELRLTEYSIP